MKTKIFAFTPLALAILFPFLAFDIPNVHLFDHDLFDYSFRVFFATIITALIGVIVVKGKMKLYPLLALVIILPIFYISMMSSMA